MGAHMKCSREQQGIGIGGVASAEHELIVGVEGVSSSGSRPPEAESFETFVRLKEAQNFAVSTPIPPKYGIGSQ